MKKLLAGLLIGGLFSLGCGDTATKPTPKKDAALTPSNIRKPGVEDKDDSKPKDEGTKDEIKPDPKKDDFKKNDPKKDSK